MLTSPPITPSTPIAVEVSVAPSGIAFNWLRSGKGQIYLGEGSHLDILPGPSDTRGGPRAVCA